MKLLVVFYSRTGITRRVAEEIVRVLKCDREEIIDTKDRSGLKGWLSGGKDASSKKLTQINSITKDPAGYDLVIIGTPIWAFTMSPAIRAYIVQNYKAFKKVAFFCTAGGSGFKKTLKEMRNLCGQAPSATLELNARDMGKGIFVEMVREFCGKIF